MPCYGLTENEYLSIDLKYYFDLISLGRYDFFLNVPWFVLFVSSNSIELWLIILRLIEKCIRNRAISSLTLQSSNTKQPLKTMWCEYLGILKEFYIFICVTRRVITLLSNGLCNRTSASITTPHYKYLRRNFLLFF